MLGLRSQFRSADAAIPTLSESFAKGVLVPGEQRTVVGRGKELARIAATLDRVGGGPSVVVIQGDAGAGKTTVWMEALRLARERGYTVLACRAAETEAKLSFQALFDLLDPVVGPLMRSLPPAQQQALQVAVLRSEETHQRIDHRTAYMATLGVLRALARRGPVVVAVDDLHSIDTASARGLAFALRRLTNDQMVIIATHRTGADITNFMVGLRDIRTDDVAIGPLDIDAIQRIVSEQLGVALTRPLLARIHRTSRGNPLLALAVAGALNSMGRVPESDEPLPVPDDLRALLLERIRTLPKEVWSVLLVIALAANPTSQMLDQLDDLGGTEAVEDARRAGVLVRTGSDLQFTHPLFASAVEATAGPDEIRRAHERLAAIVSDDEARARHLALSTITPDPIVAAEIEAAAARTHARGAPDGAAELAELARRLTPAVAVEDARRRSVAAADYSLAAGDTERALTSLTELVGSSTPGPERADMRRRLARVHYHRDSVAAAVEEAQGALEEVGADTALELDIERELLLPLNILGDIHGSREHARRVIELAEELGDGVGRAHGKAVELLSDFMLGSGADDDAIREVLSVDQPTDPTLSDARGLISHILASCGNVADARDILESLRQDLLERGDEASLCNVLFRAGYVEIPHGDISLARRLIEEAEAISRRSGQDVFLSGILSVRSQVHAFRGETDEAHACASEGIATAMATGAMLGVAFNTAALGFLASSQGDPGGACEHLGPLVEGMRGAGLDEPAVMWWLPDLIEALLALGEETRPIELIAWLEGHSQAFDRATGLAVAARSRGLLRAREGELIDAETEFAEALRQHDRQPIAYEVARTLLAKGRVERRARKWGVARESLERARALFEQVGAVMWADRANEELGRIGGRPSSAVELSETERRVAELVGAGMTNQEVGDALFVSPRTVQSNLSRVFRKLDVRSRAELAARYRAGGERTD